VYQKKEEQCLSAFEHRLFVCCNVCPEGVLRPSCTRDGQSNLLFGMAMSRLLTRQRLFLRTWWLECPWSGCASAKIA
jgi:hypothetical protein